jgi:hypothetical protein
VGSRLVIEALWGSSGSSEGLSLAHSPGPNGLPLLDRGAVVSYATWAAGPGMSASFFSSLRPRLRPENTLSPSGLFSCPQRREDVP